jgi:heme oxygenase (biliverdin-IX-beta and delta-forming)
MNGALLTHLRAVTRPAHQALEGRLGVLDKHLGRDAYTSVLARFYGFWRGWQPQVTMLVQDEGLLGPRRRLHLLEADLGALGLSGRMLEALPQCPLPALRDALEGLGSLYVMEGSTLGGRLIQQNIKRCLGNDGRASCSYFNGYGKKTGSMWLSFLARLDETPPENVERVGRGAVATFERLGWWLTR